MPHAGLPLLSEPTASLKSSFTWAFVGNSLYAACQWTLLIAVARIGNPEMVGRFALALAVTAPVVMLGNLQLRAVLVTDAENRHPFGYYLGLRLSILPLVLSAVLVISRLAAYPPETALVIFLVALAKGIESVSDMVHGLFQQRERMDWIAGSLIIRGSLSVLALSAGIGMAGNLAGGAAFLALAYAVALVAYDLPRGARLAHDGLRPRWHAAIWVRLAWLALPLGLVMMLISLSVSVPRYFIERCAGSRELGIFAAMASLPLIGATIVNALGQAATPRLTRYHSRQEFAKFAALQVRLCGIGGGVGLAGIVAALAVGRTGLAHLFGPEYAGRPDVLLLIMIGGGLGHIASSLGYGMTAARCFGPQVPVFGLVVLSVTLASQWLVPTFGVLGAAWAVVVSVAVQAAASVVVLARSIPVQSCSAAPVSRPA